MSVPCHGRAYPDNLAQAIFSNCPATCLQIVTAITTLHTHQPHCVHTPASLPQEDVITMRDARQGRKSSVRRPKRGQMWHCSFGVGGWVVPESQEMSVSSLDLSISNSEVTHKVSSTLARHFKGNSFFPAHEAPPSGPRTKPSRLWLLY